MKLESYERAALKSISSILRKFEGCLNYVFDELRKTGGMNVRYISKSEVDCNEYIKKIEYLGIGKTYISYGFKFIDEGDKSRVSVKTEFYMKKRKSLLDDVNYGYKDLKSIDKIFLGGKISNYSTGENILLVIEREFDEFIDNNDEITEWFIENIKHLNEMVSKSLYKRGWWNE